MSVSPEDYIARATAYFADVDRFDTEAILTHLTDDVVLEVPTGGVRKVGKAAVRDTYLNRADMVAQSWHGDFEFMPIADAPGVAPRLAIRLAVKRTNTDGSAAEMDNLTLLTFSGDKISSVTVWMSGENSLK